MQALVKPLMELAGVEEICRRLKTNRGVLQVSGCMESQKVHLMYGLSDFLDGDSKGGTKGISHRLVVAEDEKRARELYEDYRLYDPKACFYPPKDLLFFQADIHGNLLIKQRMQAVKGLLEKEELTVITSIDGLMDYLRPLSEISQSLIRLENDSPLNLELLAQRLAYLGYERVGQVEQSGQFAIRGGIVDIFSLTEENPWRVELWGDEVDSIRSFDVESQRSLENLEEILIYPAQERWKEEGRVTFLDYFPRERTLVFLDEPGRLSERGAEVQEEFQNSVKNRREKEGSQPLPDLLCAYQTVQKALNGCNCVGVCALDTGRGDFAVNARVELTVKSVNSYNNSFELLVKELHQWKASGYRVALLSGSRTRAERLAKDLQEQGLNSFYGQDGNREIRPGEILVLYGHVRKGFEYPLIKFAVISESDIFGREQRRKKRRKEYSGRKIRDFAELSIGDYVVHENHGLGIYRGIEKVEVDKVAKDYIKIEYRGGSNLYILATQLDLLQKYAGSDAKAPKLNRLGGQEWHRTKTRVRGAVQNIAKDLVKLYAARQEKAGFAYGKDTVWQREFEEMFPYEETEDQLNAIEDTKRDMESTKIMDRLICGDVGYGKTEIAIRAAFKAVQEGKQVVYLVPTTILAQQHYNTFVQRMKEFPVRVDLLCRFRTPAEQKKTVEDLKKGWVDVLIGTHRVLSKDVEFKDLGLLIIDEEQRFGVAHKEKIKKLKNDVDVLTLTATPIPRTLHMSLIGIRDMSVLEAAPMDRMPIQTYVMEYDEETVREAILREWKRGGQVYYVYNRVNDIADVCGRIAKLVPDAVVAYAHGQMTEHKLEKIMVEYINGEIDVLVSTTIIETGLDISNANTMIIHDSDRYGLSQLYQLRGRIGRSNRTAYAFLMYRKNVMLKETAEKRLTAIREYTDLGSGFKIAMRDLEIRGAGNLLGAEQHGHMEAVGYDLYCKMLNEAVKQEKGIHSRESYETAIDLDMDAFIPDTYISNEFQKLDVYKRIAGIESREEYEDMLEELMDRFGEPPAAVLNLLSIAALKAMAHRAYITEVKQRGKKIQLTMYERAQIDVAAIPSLMEKYPRRLAFRPEEKPFFLFEYKAKPTAELQKLLEELGALAKEDGEKGL